MSAKVKQPHVALVALVGIYSFANQASAHSCEAPTPHVFEFEQDDTPDCLRPTTRTSWDGDEMPIMAIDNTCETEAELDKLECETCQEKLELEPAEEGTLELVRADMEVDESLTQTYAWTAGDREGIIETTVTRQDTSDVNCGGGHSTGPMGSSACATSGTDGGPLDGRTAMIAFLLVAAAAGLRRKCRGRNRARSTC